MRVGYLAHHRDRVVPGEVHGWLVDLETPPDAAIMLLGPAEIARAGSYLSRHDAVRFAAGRAWLRVILSRYLDADPARLEFEAESGGRPALAGAHAGAIQFSLSRSADRGLVAVSCSPVGADIEQARVRAGLVDLVTARFGVGEARCIMAGCGGSPLRGFYRHWTAKEAYLKATGGGLAGLATTELICSPVPAIRDNGHETNQTLSLMDAAPGCVVAIVGGGPVTRLGVEGQ